MDLLLVFVVRLVATQLLATVIMREMEARYNWCSLYWPEPCNKIYKD